MRSVASGSEQVGGSGRRAEATDRFVIRPRQVRRAGVLACTLAVAASLAPAPPAARPTHLVVVPEVQARLDVLATALHREIVLCLLGRARGETAHVTELYMPTPLSSTPTTVVSGPCPATTVATWHNHPSSGAIATRSGTGARGAAPEWRPGSDTWSSTEDRPSCRPSHRDVTTAVRLRIPFLVIADGGGHHCIWPLGRLQTLADLAD